MKATRWTAVLLVTLAAALGVGLWWQEMTAELLRDELALVREEHRELVRLRAENRRLAAAQPTAGEVDRLRADHAAIIRLRAEIERCSRDIREPAI
jgi:cell division protein FtsB